MLRLKGQGLSAPARSRTWTSGSGDLRDILFTTGAGVEKPGVVEVSRAAVEGQFAPGAAAAERI